MDKKILNNIIDAKTRYENSIQSGFGKDAKKREYMNTLFNHANALIADAQEASVYEAKIKEQESIIDSLMAALEDKNDKKSEPDADEDAKPAGKRSGAKSQA